MSENNRSYKLFSFGISSDEAAKQVINHSKLVVEKDKTYIANVGNKEFTVTYHVASKLRSFYRNSIECDCCEYKYASEQAVEHILSAEEVVQKYEKLYGDKFYNSDAYMFSKPELDYDKLDKLDRKQQLERFAYFVMLCNKCADDAVLQLAAELVQKKKDGTFYQRKVLPIGAFMAVSWKCEILELVAKAVSANELQILVQPRTFDFIEYQKITTNPFLNLLSSQSDQNPPVRHRETTKTIKIQCCLDDIGSDEKEISLPVVETEDGKLALNIEPLIPLSDFKCLCGSDQEGYEFTFHNSFSEKTVEYQGNIVSVSSFYSGLPLANQWNNLYRYAKIFQNKTKLKQNCQDLKWYLFYHKDIDDQIFKKNFLKEESLYEFAYELFYIADLVETYSKEVNAQYIANTAPVNPTTGKLVQWHFWYSILDTSDEKGFNTKKPMKADEVENYIQNSRFLLRKRPMLIPFAVWSGSSKQGFCFREVRIFVQLDWERD